MISELLRWIISCLYPIMGRVLGNCAFSSRTFGAFIFAFWNVKIGAQTKIMNSAVLDAAKKGSIVIGKNCLLNRNTMLLCFGGNIYIGDYVNINPFSVLYGYGGLKIGNRVSVASGCTIVPMSHVFSDPNRFIQEQGLTAKGIAIEDDVWIGANVTILDGVKIGRGSVIGAGSVVTKDIPAYSIAVGVPCEVIRKRE